MKKRNNAKFFIYKSNDHINHVKYYNAIKSIQMKKKESVSLLDKNY